MEIKRKIEMVVATNEKYVIRKSSTHKPTACAKCGEPMLAIAQAAVLLGIKQSRVFQIVETGAAHFAEIEAGAVMICLSSLAIILDGEPQKKQNLQINETEARLIVFRAAFGN